MDYHVPVLLNEVLNLFDPQPHDIFIDATVGNGGHSQQLINRGAIVYGLDQDPTNLDLATQRINSSNFFPLNLNFSHVSEVATKISRPIKGVLFDLGLSSNQLLSQNRGFSFNDQSSLDMRLDPKSQNLTAEEIINTYSYEELYDIFSLIAQEKFSKPLILRIISARQKHPLKTGGDLANVIREYYTTHHLKSQIDPSTKIFMALRIVVNQEYDNLKTALNTTLDSSFSGTTIAFISFHSGEDRIIKQFIKKNFPNSPKPVLPTQAEISRNPLSRSAILRSYKIN